MTESLHMDSIGEFNRGMKQAEEQIFFLLHFVLTGNEIEKERTGIRRNPNSGSFDSALFMQIQGYVDNERRK